MGVVKRFPRDYMGVLHGLYKGYLGIVWGYMGFT